MVYGPEEKLIKGNLTITGDGSGTLDLKELEVKGDLIVDLPNATVRNQAKVDGYVRINDISENTWIELVDNNKLIFASENDTLIIPDKIRPKSVELKTKLTVVTSKEITVKAKKDIKIIVKAHEEDKGVEIKVNTNKDYECVTLSNRVNQEDIDKEIESRKEVKDLIDKIENLDNISLEDAEKVASIRAGYEALEEDKQALVPNLWKLENAEARIEELEAEKAEEERQAKVVAETLGKIGKTETLEDLGKITIDENLSEANKAKVETAIEAKKIDLKENKAIEDAIKEDYDKDKEIIDKQEQDVIDYYIAQSVVDQIADLGEITLESKETVKAARDAFDKLSDEQKELVDSEILDTLRAAEARIKELEGEQAEEERQAKVVAETKKVIEEAKDLETLGKITIDESLSEANKAKLEEAIKARKAELVKEKEEADKKAAQAVEEKISALGEISLDSKEAVKTARSAYNVLTESQQEFVDNLDVLEGAEAKLDNLRKTVLDDLKKNMGEFEATVIKLLNQQGRFHLEKINDNEINFKFLTNGGPGAATETTSMGSYAFGSGLATVLGQKSDVNGKAQKARIETMKKYIEMDTATIDGESFGGLTSMLKVYRMKVGDFLGTKKVKAKVKDEIAEDMYLEYTINFSLPENK